MIPCDVCEIQFSPDPEWPSQICLACWDDLRQEEAHYRAFVDASGEDAMPGEDR